MFDRASYQRELRATAFGQGLCATCRRRRARPSLRTCAGCGTREGSRAASEPSKAWHMCCQSFDVHRFDCCDAGVSARSHGPLGPTVAREVIR